ncbi:MAG: DUF5985 family protein [Hyphomicrobium sp.]|nr:DUF5985 family protein [Hyphomicrobium sp.]
MDLELYPMLMGAVAMASLVATLFFMRFWWQTHDPSFSSLRRHSLSIRLPELHWG